MHVLGKLSSQGHGRRLALSEGTDYDGLSDTAKIEYVIRVMVPWKS